MWHHYYKRLVQLVTLEGRQMLLTCQSKKLESRYSPDVLIKMSGSECNDMKKKTMSKRSEKWQAEFSLGSTRTIVSAECCRNELFVDVSNINCSGRHLCAYRFASIHNLAPCSVTGGRNVCVLRNVTEVGNEQIAGLEVLNLRQMLRTSEVQRAVAVSNCCTASTTLSGNISPSKGEEGEEREVKQTKQAA